MRIDRVWAMPNKNIFEIKPIKQLLKEEVRKGLWVDPFANRNKYENVPNLMAGLRWWLSFYNEERPHTSLPGNITPHEMYEPYLNL